MTEFFEKLMDGNVPHVKIVLGAVIVALAVYQLALISVAYGKVRPPFLGGGPAGRAHRASGDTIAGLVLFVAAACLGYYGTEGEEDGATLHVVAAIGALALLALKVVVVRWWHAAGRWLPVIGSGLFAALVTTFVSAAVIYWGED